MAQVFNIQLRGQVMTQAALDGLRERLGLRRSGRLDDSEDTGFGSRRLIDDGDAWALLQLRRDYEGEYASGDDDWSVDLYATRVLLDDETVERYRSLVLEVAAALGFVTRES